MEMNLQLHHAVSDITRATDMRIICGIVVGERALAGLAAFRDTRCHSFIEVIEARYRSVNNPSVAAGR